MELNKRLEEFHAVVERVTLVLPAPAEDSSGNRRRGLAILEALYPFILVPKLPTMPQPV